MDSRTPLTTRQPFPQGGNGRPRHRCAGRHFSPRAKKDAREAVSRTSPCRGAFLAPRRTVALGTKAGKQGVPENHLFCASAASENDASLEKTRACRVYTERTFGHAHVYSLDMNEARPGLPRLAVAALGILRGKPFRVRSPLPCRPRKADGLPKAREWTRPYAFLRYGHPQAPGHAGAL